MNNSGFAWGAVVISLSRERIFDAREGPSGFLLVCKQSNEFFVIIWRKYDHFPCPMKQIPAYI
jgi:hypothetical protein